MNPAGGWTSFPESNSCSTLESLGRMSDGPAMILVTHYLEEIMPVFSHVFLLKSGCCAARGKKDQILKRELLSQAFGIQIEAGAENGRYWSRVLPAKN